jgi:hypothetical protein
VSDAPVNYYVREVVVALDRVEWVISYVIVAVVADTIRGVGDHQVNLTQTR